MTQQNQEFIRPELIPADKSFRFKWLTVIIIFIIFPVCVIWILPSSKDYLLQHFSETNSLATFRSLVIFYSYISILAIILLTAGLQLFLAARKALEYGYFPAPNTRVIRDTWLINGIRAKYYSYMLILTGALLFVAGGYVPYFFHHLILRLLAPAG